MLVQMASPIKKILFGGIITTLGISAFVFGTTTLQWSYSYVTPQFDTASQSLELGQYALSELGDHYWVNEDGFVKDRPLDWNVKVLTLQHIIGQRYLDIFEDGSNTQTTQLQYDQLKDNQRTPTKTVIAFAPQKSYAAIAVAGTETSSGCTTCSSLTYAWNNSASATTLVVTVNTRTAASGNQTYAAVAMTDQIDTTPFVSGYVEIYTLASPTTGNNNVVITRGSAADFISSGATGLTGENTAVSKGTSIAADPGNDPPTLTVTSTIANSMLFDAISCNGEGRTLTVNASQTQIYNRGDGSAAKVQASSRKLTTTIGSYSMTWTIGGGTITCPHALLEIVPPAPPPSLENSIMFSDF